MQSCVLLAPNVANVSEQKNKTNKLPASSVHSLSCFTTDYFAYDRLNTTKTSFSLYFFRKPISVSATFQMLPLGCLALRSVDKMWFCIQQIPTKEAMCVNNSVNAVVFSHLFLQTLEVVWVCISSPRRHGLVVLWMPSSSTCQYGSEKRDTSFSLLLNFDSHFPYLSDKHQVGTVSSRRPGMEEYFERADYEVIG